MEVLSRVMAGVVRRFLPRYRQNHKLSHEQRKAMRAIVLCKTPGLGGHEYHCPSCGARHVIYHGCRNRNCPQCQGVKTLEWLDQQKGKLLPIHYYHAVFTVASELRLLFSYNRRLLYGLLFSISSATLQKYAANPRWLGAQPGLIGVLHTWGQQLAHHPHIHYIVTGGGIDSDGNWVWPKAPGGFLFPVVEMSEGFKDKFIQTLRRLHKRSKLTLPPGLDLEECLSQASSKKWEIFLQPPMAGPEKLLNYLGRYTHKVAISPSRIVEIDDTHLSFTYRDYRHAGVRKIMKLTGTEFLGRFLQHVLPQGFRRIRQYGLFRGGQEKVIEKIRQQLNLDKTAVMIAALSSNPPEQDTEPDPDFGAGPSCPDCGQPMRMGAELPKEGIDSS